MSVTQLRSLKTKTRPQMSNAGWQFVNITEYQQAKDRNVKTAVRSNAMRYYRRQEKERTTSALNKNSRPGSQDGGYPAVSIPAALPPVAQITDHPLSHDPNIRLGTWEDSSDTSQCTSKCPIESEVSELNMQIVVQASSGVPFPSERVMAWPGESANLSGLGSGNADPFDSFPIQGYPENARLLNHFGGVMARTCLPIDRGSGSDENPLRTLWIPVAMTDPVLFQATTNFAAVHLDLLQGRRNRLNILMKKAEMINLINLSLRDSERSITDTTIGAVAMLAAVERINNNLDELRIHMNAISKMVTLRGGLERLGWKGVLHMFLSWEDLLSASMLASRPVFAPTPYCALIDDPLLFRQIVPSQEDWRGLSKSMLEILHDMRVLTQHMLRFRSETSCISDIEMMKFSRARSSIAYRLQSMQIFDKHRGPFQATDFVFEGHRLAAFIYVNMVLRASDPGFSVLTALKRQLIKTIQESEGLLPATVLQPRSAIWVPFIGGLLAADNVEENWFAERIVRTMAAANLHTWSDVEEILLQNAWTDNLRTPVCRSLWSRVQEIRCQGLAD